MKKMSTHTSRTCQATGVSALNATQNGIASAFMKMNATLTRSQLRRSSESGAMTYGSTTGPSPSSSASASRLPRLPWMDIANDLALASSFSDAALPVAFAARRSLALDSPSLKRPLLLDVTTPGSSDTESSTSSPPPAPPPSPPVPPSTPPASVTGADARVEARGDAPVARRAPSFESTSPATIAASSLSWSPSSPISSAIFRGSCLDSMSARARSVMPPAGRTQADAGTAHATCLPRRNASHEGAMRPASAAATAAARGNRPTTPR
mmetsp:Transcript_7048/g.25066  ORF Transcript_7048/g.25066 Transcript_7048/m.25066 type:complete len:267 (-) Transcript_7048:52-852(-)